MSWCRGDDDLSEIRERKRERERERERERGRKGRREREKVADNMKFPQLVFAIWCIVFCLLHVRCVASQGESCDSETVGKNDAVSQDEMLIDVLGRELNARYLELGKVSDSDEHLTRHYMMSPAWFKAAAIIKGFMEDAGLTVWQDAIGNIRGRTPVGSCIDDNAPALVMGSHFDTVRNGGKYDGMLGVLHPISAVKALLLSLKDEATGETKKLVRPIELIAFGFEDGGRFFNGGLFASRAVTGELVKTDQLNTILTEEGQSLAEVLNENGFDGSKEAVSKAKLDPENVYAFVEMHIEQGPVLESMGLSLGVISKIVGSGSFLFSLKGVQGHAGQVQMVNRKDAVTATAEIILGIESLCGGHERGVESMLVCTVGKVEVKPNVVNVISGDVVFSVNMRCLDDDILREVASKVKDLVAAVTSRRGLEFEILNERPMGRHVPFDPSLTAKLVAAGEKAYISSARLWGPNVYTDDIHINSSFVPNKADNVQPGTVAILPSGAGHDAMAMTKLTPQVAMLWLRCRDGVSHSPLEYVTERDVAEGGMALFHFLEEELLPPM